MIFVRCVGIQLCQKPRGSCGDDSDSLAFDASDVIQNEVVFGADIGVVKLADFRNSCTSEKQCRDQHQRRIRKNTRNMNRSGMSIADWLRLVARRLGL